MWVNTRLPLLEISQVEPISVTATQVFNVKDASPPYNIMQYKPSILP